MMEDETSQLAELQNCLAIYDNNSEAFVLINYEEKIGGDENNGGDGKKSAMMRKVVESQGKWRDRRKNGIWDMPTEKLTYAPGYLLVVGGMPTIYLF